LPLAAFSKEENSNKIIAGIEGVGGEVAAMYKIGGGWLLLLLQWWDESLQLRNT